MRASRPARASSPTPSRPTRISSVATRPARSSAQPRPPARSSGPKATMTDDDGDRDAEYEALRTDAALVDLSDRGSVRVTGPDARSFLDSLASQDLTVLADGDGAHS